MKHLRISTLVMAGLILMANLAYAQNLEDVIYKKDGSVLRGVLVEQDFEKGRYKIQLQGGSLFSVEKEDIEKITKEAPINAASVNNGININIDNNPTINQNPVIEQNPTISPVFNNNVAREKATFDHVFYIGTMGKSWMIDDSYKGTDGETYTGLNLSYKRNFTKHLAVYSAFNAGSITSLTEEGVDYDVSSDDPDIKYRSLEVDALLGTNFYEGWQFYTGLGLFNEHYSYYDTTYTGTNFILGLGYSWETMQLQFRIAINSSSDYGDDESHSLGNFQLGFNF